MSRQVRQLTQKQFEEGVRAGAVSESVNPATASTQALALLDGLQL